MKVTALTRNRIGSIDLLRGVVMVIMALDHVRDFFHADASINNPLDPATTNPALFFTRFITHFCAPIFLFLAGISAFLMSLRKPPAELALFLIKRGLWLILVEVLLVTLAITFDPLYHVLILQVIWAIGISMVIMGMLIGLRIPFGALLFLALLILVGHNLLDYAETPRNVPMGVAWDLVHHGLFTVYRYAPGHAIVIVYAFLPWTGILILGYCFGRLYAPGFDGARRRSILLRLGLAMIVLFFVLRTINYYGDPVPWKTGSDTEKTIFSFFGINKYPPSLDYICITLGAGFVFLALTENVKSRLTEFFCVFGSVPFFYYVVHFFLIHLLTVIAFFVSGYGVDKIADPKSFFLFRPVVFGYPLWVVYLLWFLVIAIMYPLCRRFSRYKAAHREWWLSYV